MLSSRSGKRFWEERDSYVLVRTFCGFPICKKRKEEFPLEKVFSWMTGRYLFEAPFFVASLLRQELR